MNTFISLYIHYRSLADPELDDSLPVDGPVSFHVIANGSKRGGPKLVSSDGYSYTVRVSPV